MTLAVTADSGGVTNAQFAADGAALVTSSQNDIIRIWRAAGCQHSDRTHHRSAHGFTVWKVPEPVGSTSTWSREPSRR